MHSKHRSVKCKVAIIGEDCWYHQWDFSKESSIHFVYCCNCVFVSPAVDGDPHFMIELPDRNDALCFNINNAPETIFNLVRDPESGQLSIQFITAFFFLINKLKIQSLRFFCLLCMFLIFFSHLVRTNKSYSLVQWTILIIFPQVFWSMARSLETRRFHQMGKLTPIFAVLASSTRLWGSGWRWALKTFQCSRMANRSSCCGQIQPLSKDPSEWSH